MRLESTSSSALILLSSALLALGACGDDGSSGDGGTAGSSDTGATTDTPTTNSSVDTTGDNPGTTTDDPTTGLDSTGDDMPGTDSGSEDSSGDPPMGDCMAGMSFSTLTSTNNDLITQLTVEGIVNCDLPITITATGGTVCAEDDGAGGFFYTVDTIALEDVPPVACGLANVGLSNLSIENNGDSMEVVIPQDGGDMVGNQSISIVGDVEGTALMMEIEPMPLADFDGVLPEGSAAFGDSDTSVAYLDMTTTIATANPVVFGQRLTVTLTGLTGGLTFAE